MTEPIRECPLHRAPYAFLPASVASHYQANRWQVVRCTHMGGQWIAHLQSPVSRPYRDIVMAHDEYGIKFGYRPDADHCYQTATEHLRTTGIVDLWIDLPRNRFPR